MDRMKAVIGMMVFLLCWTSSFLHAAEPARLPFYEVCRGEVRFYLLGTMHAGKEGKPLRQEIVQALAQSAQLVQELSAEEERKIILLMPALFCRDACLRRQISNDAFAKLTARLPRIKEAALEKIPAWLASTMLTVADMAQAGLFPQWGTEQQLMTLWDNRPVYGLETVEEQLDVFRSMEDSVQGAMLADYLALPEEERMALFQALYQVWQDGDAEALYTWYQKMYAEDSSSPEIMRIFNERVIFLRNKRFVERLQPHLAPGKPVFVAVGVLHLGGDQGMLALLRAQGFDVTAR